MNVLKQQKIFSEIYNLGIEDADTITNIKFINHALVIKDPVLEVGSGKGYVLNYLTNGGFDVVGVEVSEEAVKYTQNNYNNSKIFLYDGKNLPFDSSTFNTVLSFDVIEHIETVKFHLLEVYRVLKTNGIYAFQTPNILTNLPKEIVFRGGIKKARDFHPSVQSYFSLKNLLTNCGFNFRFISMPLISEEKYNLLSVRSLIWKAASKILKHFPYKIVPVFLRPNFWVIANKLN